MTMVVAALFVCLVCFLSSSASADKTCSYPWTIASEDNGIIKCECGDTLYGVVGCDPNTLQLNILQSYCMTHSDALNTTIGHCGMTFLKLYTPLNTTNISTLNDAMCGRFHRADEMCGRCKEGYAPPVYSYSLTCVECSDYEYNWLKYIAVAFFPLTLFYVSVLILRISALSGNLNIFILLCQLISAPGIMLMYGLYLPFIPLTIRRLIQLIMSLYGVWNLDFFRTIYTPFCLHPNLTTLQVLILDYAVAVYPLLLIFITYVCVSLHDHSRMLVLLWSPFYRCLARIRREWHIRESLIDVFATFLLLSYVKILNISTTLLTPTALYNVHGQKLHNYVLYFDGTVQYLSRSHIPYALLAIFMLSVFNIIPIIVLCLYPCRWFQRCLNHCPCQLQALHTFMDAFQGSFKTSPRDCRYFAAVYLFLRVLNLVAQGVLQSALFIPLIGLLFFVTSLFVCFMKPRKYYWHNLVDSLLLALAAIGLILFFTINSASHYVDPIDFPHGNSAIILACVIGSLPAVYWTIFFVYNVTPKSVFNLLRKRCLARGCNWKFCQTEEMQFEEGSEQTTLLNDY